MIASYRPAGLVLVLTLVLWSAPAAAIAYFSGGTSAATAYSAAFLPAPAGEETIVSCTKGLLSTRITVDKYGKVPKANYHEVNIYSGAGTTPVFTGDLSQPSGSTYTTSTLLSGSWRVVITGQYKVPGSTNVWISQPLSRTVSC